MLAMSPAGGCCLGDGGATGRAGASGVPAERPRGERRLRVRSPAKVKMTPFGGLAEQACIISEVEHDTPSRMAVLNTETDTGESIDIHPYNQTKLGS